MRYVFIALLMITTAKELLATRHSPEEKQAIIKLAQNELAYQQKENPLRFFEPNGAIEKLITEVGSNDKKWIFVLPAANSVGKSAASINILGNIIWGSQSEWFQGKRFSKWTFPKKFWYMSEKDTLKNFVCGIDESTESEISKWFPRGRYSVQKAGYEYFSQLTTDNLWSGMFKSYDQEVKQFESDKIGVAIFDEPPPESIFNAVLARLTMGGIILMPMTPLTNSAWTLDRLVNNASQESDIFVLYADIEENCRTHGIRGRLEHSQIERIISFYDPEELDARAHGKFTHLSGLVYKNIHPATHRHSFTPDHFKQSEFQIFNVVDPHDARPPFVGWFAVDKYKNAWGIDEYPNEMFHLIRSFNLTTPEICKIIKEREIANGWDGKKITRIMDPNFGNKPIQAVGKTTAEYFAACGRDIDYSLWYNTSVNDDLFAGHRMVRDWLSVNADGETRFKIAENCQNIWYQLTHYSRNERKGRALEIHGPGENVSEKFKDGADVVRYFFMAMRPPKKEEATQTKKPWYADMMEFNQGQPRTNPLRPSGLRPKGARA